MLVLEKAPAEWAGGNTYFTAGAIRTVHGGLDDLLPLIEPVTDDEAAAIELPPYTGGRLPRRHAARDPGPLRPRADVGAGRGRLDARSRLAAEQGMPLRLMYERQSFAERRPATLLGRAAIGTVGGGQGLVSEHLAAAERAGVEMRFDGLRSTG